MSRLFRLIIFSSVHLFLIQTLFHSGLFGLFPEHHEKNFLLINFFAFDLSIGKNMTSSLSSVKVHFYFSMRKQVAK